MSKKVDQRLTNPHEPMSLSVLKAGLYLGAVLCYFAFFTSPWALGGAALSAMVALTCVHLFEPRLSARGTLFFGGVVGASGYLLSSTLEGFSLWGAVLAAPMILRLSEMLFFSTFTFMTVFFLRVWGRRSRIGGGVEALVICNAVVQLFSTHRLGQIHEPRFFSDWVIISGQHSVQWWLTLFGVILAAVALLVTSRVRRSLHLVLAFGMVAFLLSLFYFFGNVGHKAKSVQPLTLGGASGQKNGEGKEGDDGGKGEGESDQNSPQNRPPTPVAVAVFHDDYSPEYGILYFRQQTLSYFDGVKLVADSARRFDGDVLSSFPNDQVLKAKATQSIENHLKVSTSMYLIDEHPTPPSLTNATEISPLENPAPQRFVEAYSVTSLVPAIPLSRYVGRQSIPSEWDMEKRAFYLDTHVDDPRYLSLAEEIVRELPSRLSADPIQRAIAIKHFLEQEGYYTLKVKHRSSRDPAASFLFGDLRGYCVHFAHSAVHLLRSQGIAARVALGYAVDARTRSNSSAVLITGDRAHAWPEIHIEGVGWVTFDIYPERSDEQSSQSVSQSLESLFGEMARRQLDRGIKRGEPFPWKTLALRLVFALLLLVFSGYFVGLWRLLRRRFVPMELRGRLDFQIALDRLSGAGLSRSEGESRERYAERLSEQAPGLGELTKAHLSWALGDPQHRERRAEQVVHRSLEVRRAFFRASKARWVVSVLNPFSWVMSR